jgi:hypothetical protein
MKGLDAIDQLPPYDREDVIRQTAEALMQAVREGSEGIDIPEEKRELAPFSLSAIFQKLSTEIRRYIQKHAHGDARFVDPNLSLVGDWGLRLVSGTVVSK